MTPHADKRFGARVRTIKDPVELLGKLVRQVGPLHPHGNEGALFRQAQRVLRDIKHLREQARDAKRRAVANE